MAMKPLHHIYIYSNNLKEARVWTQALQLFWLQLPVRPLLGMLLTQATQHPGNS